MRNYNAKYLRKKLDPIFADRASVRLAYFFGSSVSRNTGALSDVDIAILWDDGEKEQLIKEAGIQRRIRELFKDERFEVGSLNTKALSFCYNVIRQGVCIFGSEKERVRYETYILDEYLDFQYLAQQYNRAFKEALLEDRLKW